MAKQAVTILDGALGRELENYGAPFRQPEWSALAMMQTPDIVAAVHRDYIRSGAEVITTNSYALVPFHIGESAFASQGERLAERAGQVARHVADTQGQGTLVAGCIPPLFGSYRADLYQPERAGEIAQPLINGLNASVDLWLCETQSLIAEAQTVVELIRASDRAAKPIWVSFTLQDEALENQPCIRSGETVLAAVQAMAELDIQAILFNCCQPEVIAAALQVTTQTLADINATHIHTGAYANAFPPQSKDATANDGLDVLRTDLTPPAYLQWAQTWQRLGADIIGGCCGIGPKHIAELSRYFGQE